MNRSDMIFGEARENAPPRRYIDPETPVLVNLPSCSGGWTPMTYARAERLHYELGQTLARMMRKRGSATPPDGDTGGTPAALKVAA